ncbi:pectinesterase-like [Populus alba x Populus x berolinensis]|nr:pectinesterase-like [Populus alba x Populus x berolinensis]
MYLTRGRTKHLLFLLPISILFVTLLSFKRPAKFSSKTIEIPRLHIHKHIQIAHSACKGTLYPELCVSTLVSLPDLASKSLPEFISATLNKTMDEVRASSANCNAIRNKMKLGPLEKAALKDFRKAIKKGLYNISHHVSNSLAMLKKIPGVNTSKSEVFPEYGNVKHGFPSWLSSTDRNLLQASANSTKFDLIVAKDGTGNFTTISEAVRAAPNSSDTRFVIYIKAGAYFENVEVERKKKMLVFIGDGIGKTVVKANRSVIDGWTTFRSATVAVVGEGFIAKGITFENSAGPSKHQAVALRSGSDLSAFYQCSFVGYQDTLYVHSLRQFYRECDIYGTIDFIFGNAAVVFQTSNLYARKPNSNQRNIFTAQGREDPNQNTGISILNCKVAAAADLIPVKSSFQTFLGRPWKEYSRTVFLRSYIDDLVDPAGWLEWNASFALSTLYYGEYMNRGPGSNTSARVTWPGYRIITNSTEASQFTVGAFIQGNTWLNSTDIPYFLNLN